MAEVEKDNEHVGLSLSLFEIEIVNGKCAPLRQLKRLNRIVINLVSNSSDSL